MTRLTQSVVLVLVGGTVLGLAIGDLYLRYVKESMRPYLIASALVLIALGVLAWMHDEEDPGHEGHDGEHDLDHRAPRVAWLLLLPVFAISVVNPPALGAFVADRQAGSSQPPPPPADGIAFTPLPGGAAVPLTIGEFATRAVYDAGGTLVDRSVKLVGFATPVAGGGWNLSRLSLACCAADAFVNRVRVAGQPAPTRGTWVQVIGTWQPSAEQVPRHGVPVIRAASVVEIEAPTQPYE